MKAIDLEVQYLYYKLIGENKYNHQEIIQIIQIYNQLMKILYNESNYNKQNNQRDILRKISTKI